MKYEFESLWFHESLFFGRIVCLLFSVKCIYLCVRDHSIFVRDDKFHEWLRWILVGIPEVFMDNIHDVFFAVAPPDPNVYGMDAFISIVGNGILRIIHLLARYVF